MTDEKKTKSYIKLDDDLIDDYQPPSQTTGAPPQPTPVATSTNPVATSSTTQPTSIAAEMAEIEEKMYQVAVDTLNQKRAQAHLDIDLLYDEMLAATKEQLGQIGTQVAQKLS